MSSIVIKGWCNIFLETKFILSDLHKSFKYQLSSEFCYVMNLVSGIATGSTTEGRISSPGEGQEFSLLHVVQTGSGAHPAS
jgi:hypothetical protein